MRSLVATLLVISGALFTAVAAQQSEQVYSQPSVTAQTTTPQSTSSGDESVSEPALLLKATSRMVLLDVVATDKQGKAITGLKASDFTVLEKGREQTIKSFGLEQPAAEASARPATLKLPPDVFSNIQFTQQPETLNVILLDSLNTNMRNQMLVHREMLKFLETMPAGQLIAVYTLTRDLHLLQDFSSDPDVLKKVAKSYNGSVSVALQNATEKQATEAFSLGDLNLPPEFTASLQDFLATESALELEMRVRMTTQALVKLARTLAGYPGRKNLIWISSSFPLNLFPESGHEMFSYNSWGKFYHYDGILRKTSNALVDAQVAVYPIDAAGLVADQGGTMDAGYDSIGTGEKLDSTRNQGVTYGAVLNSAFQDAAATHNTMNGLAERTGGKAFYNRNDLHTAIQRSITDGSSYYQVGYYPLDKNWKGEFRKIEVKVNHPGVRLRYRPGYYAIENQKDAKDSNTGKSDITDALSLSNPSSTMLFFTAALAPPSAQSPNKVVVNYRIEGHSIAFEEGADGLRHAALGCYVQAFNEKGKPVKAVSQLPVAALKPATYQRVLNEGFPCTTTIELPGGKYQLRFAVRDERTGLIGTANGKVTVP
jgi:VWFA-related protein